MKWAFDIKSSQPISHINHDSHIIKDEHGEYWMCISTELEPKSDTQAPKLLSSLDGIVACDPGVRSFQTTYNPSGQCTEWGRDAKDKIFRVCYELDKLQSEISFTAKNYYVNRKMRHRRIRNLKRASCKYRKRIKNLIKEMHCKLSQWLLENHRIILLPEFNTKEMVGKLKSDVARSMLTLSHYKFKERLLFKQKEYPWAKVVIVKEDYTSQTCTRCGNLHKTSSKIYHCKKCNLEMDRDLMGSRNILIKYLTEHLDSYNVLKVAAMPSRA